MAIAQCLAAMATGGTIWFGVYLLPFLVLPGSIGAGDVKLAAILGAAVGTLVARVLEFLIVLVYILKFDKKTRLFTGGGLWKLDPVLRRDYTRVYIPIMCSQVLWGISVPMQTAILGHLSADAIAANSVATTFYQYLKVVVIAMSSVSAVMIGNAIGRGDMKRIKSDARSMAAIDVAIGLVLGLALFLLRDIPLRERRAALRGQTAGPEAWTLADTLCPRVGQLFLDFERGEEELGRYLRAAYGAVALHLGQSLAPQVSVELTPMPALDVPTLRLWGKPDLRGLTLAPLGELPPGLPLLPFLTLLWETGRVGPEELAVAAQTDWP